MQTKNQIAVNHKVILDSIQDLPRLPLLEQLKLQALKIPLRAAPTSSGIIPYLHDITTKQLLRGRFQIKFGMTPHIINYNYLVRRRFPITFLGNDSLFYNSFLPTVKDVAHTRGLGTLL